MQEKVKKMSNDMLPVGTAVHINLEDMKWECNDGDLISRSELIKALEPYRFAICGFEGVLALINNAPTVEYTFEEAFQKTVCEQKLYCPERPKGEWVSRSGGYYKCSNCGEVERSEKNYCPNCGMKMLKCK